MPLVVPVLNRLVKRSSQGTLARQSSGRSYTNLCLQSEVLGTTWVLTNATQTANTVANPINGAVTADKLVEDATAGAQHRINQTITVLNGTAYCFSIFAKAVERANITLRISNATGIAQASFNLTAGTILGIVNPTVAAMTAYPNGWFRCSIAGVTNSTSSIIRVNLGENATDNIVVSYNGDGASGLRLFGGQFQQGFTATEYIPTTTIAVTREES